MRRIVLSLIGLTLTLGAVGGSAWLPATGQTPSAPPPTPVPPLGSPSPYPSTLATPEVAETRPVLSAGSGALVDLESGRVLFARAARERRPIASITKIVTALVVLDSAEMKDTVTVSALAAAQGGASLDLVAGERIRLRHLLYALLLQSSNDAAVALAEHVSGSVEAFVAEMNRRVRAMGLRDTRFRSPHGLDDRGFSTALDLARITVRALRDPVVARIVRTRFYRVPVPAGGSPRKIQNRNALLWLYPGAVGVKSGFTAAAGSSLVAAADRNGFRLASVVLGAPAEAFSDSATLLDWGYAHFERRRMAIQGERFEPVEVEGQEVHVEAVRSLYAVLRKGMEVERRVLAEPGLSLPVPEGERLGELLVTGAEGRELGRVPVVSVEEVGPPPPRLPFARRLFETTTGFLAGMFRSILG